ALGYQGGSIETAWQYAGTDEAPEASQITASDTLSKTHAVVVPITQTAIAVVVHPPVGCQFEEEAGITWGELNEVFGGNGISKWSDFENTEGSCESAITRVVRKETSGTTYQFKNYLATLEKSVANGGEGAEAPPCAPIAGDTTWASLRKNNGGATKTTNPN